MNPGNGSSMGKFQAAMHIRRNSRLNVLNSVFVGWPIGIILDNEKGDTQGSATKLQLQDKDHRCFQTIVLQLVLHARCQQQQHPQLDGYDLERHQEHHRGQPATLKNGRSLRRRYGLDYRMGKLGS